MKHGNPHYRGKEKAETRYTNLKKTCDRGGETVYNQDGRMDECRTNVKQHDSPYGQNGEKEVNVVRA